MRLTDVFVSNATSNTEVFVNGASCETYAVNILKQMKITCAVQMNPNHTQ